MITVLAVLIALGYGYMWFSYYRNLKREKEECVNLELKPMLIRGVIFRLDDYGEKKPAYYTLVIKNGEEDLSYGILFCKENESFREFSSVGDSIIKQPNSLKVKVIKKETQQSKKFGFPFCDD